MSFPKRIPPRSIVYPKDVENITGLADRTARNVIQNVRKAFGKQKHQFITIREFCAYTGIDEDLVREYMVE
jgi:cytochrome oxidase assembly protein ShyY1